MKLHPIIPEKVPGNVEFMNLLIRDQRNGAVIVRCSQPEVGWFSWRCTEDESILQSIISACGMNCRQSPTRSSTLVAGDAGAAEGDAKKMLIIDARSYTAALANRTKGGGVECSGKYMRSMLGNKVWLADSCS